MTWQGCDPSSIARPRTPRFAMPNTAKNHRGAPVRHVAQRTGPRFKVVVELDGNRNVGVGSFFVRRRYRPHLQSKKSASVEVYLLLRSGNTKTQTTFSP